jgi:transcription elongation factor Elf1
MADAFSQTTSEAPTSAMPNILHETTVKSHSRQEITAACSLASLPSAVVPVPVAARVPTSVAASAARRLLQFKYTCPRCNRAYLNQAVLRLHICLRLGQNRLVCRFCSRPFESAELFYQHEHLHLDPRTESHWCDRCGSGPMQLDAAVRHTHNHYRFFCRKCGLRFINKQVADKHRATAHVSTSDGHPCSFCALVLPTARQLEAHQGTSGSCSCSSCGATFLSGCMLLQHTLAGCTRRAQ